jgi:hypothetical protein
MIVNEFRTRAVPAVGCAYRSGFAALPARRPGFPLLRPVSPTGRGAGQRRAGGLKRGDAGFIPIDALAPCEPTRLSNGELMERHLDTIAGSTVSSLSAADQLALLLFREHYRQGAASRV